MSVQDQPGNLSAREASPHEVAGLGIALSLAGFYFMLGSIGVLPMPDAEGPAFLVFAAGAAFLFAGLFCLGCARTEMNDNLTTLPEASPVWIKLSYQMLAIGIFGAFATIGTWIAIECTFLALGPLTPGAFGICDPTWRSWNGRRSPKGVRWTSRG